MPGILGGRLKSSKSEGSKCWGGEGGVEKDSLKL